MKVLKLPVVVTQDEDGYFLAEVPVLHSCFTQGKTKKEALYKVISTKVIARPAKSGIVRLSLIGKGIASVTVATIAPTSTAGMEMVNPA